MKNIDTILEEFENKFVNVVAEEDGGSTWKKRGNPDDVPAFLRTTFDEYKTGLREAVEEMKVEHHHSRMCKVDEFTCAAMEEAAETRNQGLDSVLELLK